MRAPFPRVPFTTALGVVILTVAIANGSALGELSAAIGRQWGFDPFHFWEGRWHSLATGAVLVRNAAMLIGILTFLGVSVGIYEWRRGTPRTLLLFLLAHIATLLLTTVLLVYPLHLAGAPLANDWAPSGDVGASFGEFGCLGGWIRRVGPAARAKWLFIATLALALKLAVYPERFGDVGHVLALYVGMLVERFIPDRPTRASAVSPSR